MQAALFIFNVVVTKSPGRRNYFVSESGDIVYHGVQVMPVGTFRHLVTFCRSQEENIIHACTQLPLTSYVVQDPSSGNAAPHRVVLLTRYSPSDMTKGPSERWFQTSSGWQLRLAIIKHFMSGHISDVVWNSWLLGIHKPRKVGLLQDPSSFTLFPFLGHGQ